RRARIEIADARHLPLSAASVDIVITSPPYLNAIDYLRAHKFSLVWMGHRISSLRDIRSSNIGTEVSTGSNPDSAVVRSALANMGTIDRLPRRQQGMLTRYVEDMNSALGEIARVIV